MAYVSPSTGNPEETAEICSNTTDIVWFSGTEMVIFESRKSQKSERMVLLKCKSGRSPFSSPRVTPFKAKLF